MVSQFSVQPHYTSDSDSTSRAGRSDGNMIYAAAKQIKLEDAGKNPPVPLHPGAEKFYKEKGAL